VKDLTFADKLKTQNFNEEICNIFTMLSVFIIVFKGTFGIMGWRRKILVSTLLGFLVTVMVFELADHFEAADTISNLKGNEHHHKTMAILKHITMWFWPEFLIDTLEHMVKDNLPVKKKST